VLLVNRQFNPVFPQNCGACQVFGGAYTMSPWEATIEPASSPSKVQRS